MWYPVVIGILLVSLIIFTGWLRFSLKSRFNLESYIILLLMKDNLREEQKTTFQEWIQREDFNDAKELHRRARFIISFLANSFAKKSLSFWGAHEILWNYRKSII